MRIEKFKRASIDKEVIYDDYRSVNITVGDTEFNIQEFEGGLAIQKHDGRITIEPNVSNEIVVY